MSICKTMSVCAGAVAGIAVAATAAIAQDPAGATARMQDLEGRPVGQVQLRETPHGLIVTAEFTALPEGAHGFHIHGVGACEPPFKSAGGHLNPDDHQHGMQNPHGLHAGDFPNLHVPGSGELTIELFAMGLTLDRVLDGDGAAMMVHSGADDYTTDPAGEAGDRIACGVIGR